MMHLKKEREDNNPLLLPVHPLLSCLLNTLPMGRIQPEVNWLRNQKCSLQDEPLSMQKRQGRVENGAESKWINALQGTFWIYSEVL